MASREKGESGGSECIERDVRAGHQPAKDLQEKVLGALVLGLGEGVAPSGEGSDRSMGSSV